MIRRLAPERFVRTLLACVALVLSAPITLSAQSLPNLTEQQLNELARQVQQGKASRQEIPALDQSRQQGASALRGTSPMAATPPAAAPFPSGSVTPGPTGVLSKPLSPLEADYSKRTAQTLRQFGYDVFSQGVRVEAPFSGAVGEDYLLGIGDEVVVTFLADTTDTVTARVDREGRLLLPGLPPLTAAGRRFDDFRRELEARVQATRIGTQVFVSVGAVRMIRVIVAGEVTQAGVYPLTGLSTLLDALYSAGGISKTGSLRQVRLNRGGKTTVVDLYDLLVGGQLRDQAPLMDGDQVVVPPLGPTVAVGGDVKRPGIYELAPGGQRATLAEIAEWAGGPMRPTGNRFLHMTLDARGLDQVTERTHLPGVLPREGDILLVQESGAKYRGSVYLAGHARSPGLRSLAAAPAVSRLIPDIDAFRASPYLLLAVLSRLDRSTGARTLAAVNLIDVLARRSDARLEADDVLIVLSLEDIKYLDSEDVQRAISGQLAEVIQKPVENRKATGLVEELVTEKAAPPAAPKRLCRGLVELGAALVASRTGRYGSAIRAVVSEAGQAPRKMDCPQVYEDFPESLLFLLEHVVALYGEARLPGVYPIRADTPLSYLLDYAGGTMREADLTNVEVTRFEVVSAEGLSTVTRQRMDLAQTPAAQIRLSPGDVVRVNPVFTERESGPVALTGEFVRPGVYSITRGERLSGLIARAGGVTEQAYPYGAVFTRERVKEEERRNFDRYLRELQSAMAVAASKARTEAGGTAAVEAVKNLVDELRRTPPLGRVVVEADPTVLQVRPEEDLILEPGDRLHMPKRPNYVTITGEVLNPGTVAFRSDTSSDKYIDMAGGLSRASDEGRTFVVLPNGTAQPLSVSAWNYEARMIPPGSTIVVPRDPLPFDWLTLSRDLTGIISNLAVTAAALSTINN